MDKFESRNWNLAASGIANASNSYQIPTFTVEGSGTAVITVIPVNGTGGAACPGPSVSFNINVINVNPGTIGNDQVFCYGGLPALLISGNNGTGTGTLSYQWQESTTEPPPGNWTNIIGATSLTYQPPSLTQTTWFRRVITATYNGVACSAATPDIEITMSPVNPGIIASNQSVCSGGNPAPFTSTSDPTNRYRRLNPKSARDSVIWQSSADGGANWTTLISGQVTVAPSPLFVYDPPAGITTPTVYRRIYIGKRTNGNSTRHYRCVTISNLITVTVNPLPTVTVNSPTVCHGTSATIIAAPGTAGTYNYAWTVPFGAANPGNVATFTTTVAGTYSVVITNTTTSCSSALASGTLTVNPLPNTSAIYHR